MTVPPSSLSILRPEDLLHLRFYFVNLVANTDDPKSPYLTRDNPDEEAYLIVYFPPQHLNEEAYFETEPKKDEFPGNSDPPDNPDPTSPVPLTTPTHVHIAGNSRLVFRIPAAIKTIPYTLDGLLNWADLELSVVPAALPPNPLFTDPSQRPFLINPYKHDNKIFTALELPYRLTLSPNHKARWFHSLLPVTRNGRSELWHTRLGTRLSDGSSTEAPNDQRTVRAIWSFDFNEKSNDLPPSASAFLASLNPRDRHKLVHQSANFHLKLRDGSLYDPEHINVDQMMLTSQGAWMKIDGAWDVVGDDLGALGLNIESWKHTTTQGRDQYVRVVYAGFLYPFWHRASLVKITERKIQSPTNNEEKVTAFLRQRLYIIVREPEKTYTHPAHNDRYQRANPFYQKIRILNRITPNLDPPLQAGDTGFITAPEESFWVHVAGEPFQFHLQAKDLAGKTIDFHTALIFVPNEGNINLPNMAGLRSDYLKPAVKDWRKGVVNSKKVTYAPSGNGDTTLQTSGFFVDTEVAPNTTPLQILPKLETAVVNIPAVEQIVGSQAPQSIKLFGKYIDDGLEAATNQAALFAELVDASGAAANLGVDISPDMAGGLATPNMAIRGLSRHLGPVAGNLSNLAGGNFDPTDFFPADAKLLGGITLRDIIQAIFDVEQFPKMLTEEVKDTLGVPEKLVTKLDWHPQVQDTAVFRTQTNPNTDLLIAARFEQKLTEVTAPSYAVNGHLKHFAINFLEVIEVKFDSVSFKAGSNSKLDVSAEVTENGINFLGPLSFLNELRKFIPETGFVDPPFLDVTPTGASVGFTQALPPLAVGVFSLTNVSVGAVLHLPFTSDPMRLRFNFSERHDPFNITVTLLGGGGFFALALGLDGIEMIEAALEFGGNVSINLGVASGGIYIMAGIYFKYVKTDKVTLAGYVRCGGYLNVLGLISISVEFYLELAYQSDTGKATGRASVTVKVEVLFFSKTVKLTVEKSFSGSSDDPTFGDVLTANDWKKYGLAFG